MMMLNEAACIGFFPNRKLGTRRAPSIDNLSIRSWFGTDPFEEIKDQRVNWVWHKCKNSLSPQGTSHSPRVIRMAVQCYGSGAPGRKFFEDIAATPDSSSPWKCPGAEPGTQSSSSFGSANQKTTWFR